METKNDQAIVTDREFIALLHAAQKNDPEAMLQLIDLFKEDIMRASQYIQLPQEDAVAEIVVELLEFIKGREE
ncbi:hypothetical protein [Paenibacillus sp. GCM10028914]|uniref:hypothetical protein n=1 Tax=Paenibacillus sp. GCM10028914 TaxID=3273416 RepID=UPI0036160E5E